MGKKTVLLCLSLAFFSGSLWPENAFLDAINPSRLPQSKTFREEIVWYREFRDEIGKLGIEEPTPPGEAEITVRLRKLLDLTEAHVGRDPRNPDLLLFRVLLYWDFYVLTWTEYRDEIPAELKRIESLYPFDYRAFWLLGVYYAAEVRPLESMKQFSYVTDTFRLEALPAAFLRSYASAAGFADMPKHAREACRGYALRDPAYVMEEDIVFRNANRFQPSGIDTMIPPGSLYQFQVREEGFGILCRLFGVYIPVDRAWGTRSAEVRQNGSRLTFSPDPSRGPVDGEVQIAITMEFQAYGEIPFIQLVEERLRRYKSAKRLEETPGAYPFLMFEVVDSARYRPAGGLHGFCFFLIRSEPAVKGLGIERPVAAIFDPKTGEPYYRPQQLFDRYDGDICYIITLDCGEDVFPAAAPVFRSFVKGMLFD